MKSVRMDRLLSSVYSINSSQTKKVVISLEYDNKFQQFEPKLRLTGNDSNEVPFTVEEWGELRSIFGDINLFYGSYRQTTLGERLSTNKHSVKLFMWNSDRAIEITEICDEVDDGQTRKKKYVPAIIYKFTTFENLTKIVRCIDNKFTELKNVADVLDRVIDEFVKYLEVKLEKPGDTFICARDLGDTRITMTKESAEKIKNNLNSDLSCEKILSMFYDFVCIKPDYLAYEYNIRFDKSG